THDYTRKSGVAEAVILTPATAPAWCTNRAELWNAVEKAERRKEQEDRERSRAERRAEQLRKNDNAVMDSGVLSAVVTGYGE
ncbi:MobA/MobL family protein, partial [Escherichia coli]|uniref:MobA/MobL family protein n=1 Tax=Escherichia coli TaxID=562 RepID=UPI001FA737FF